MQKAKSVKKSTTPQSQAPRSDVEKRAQEFDRAVAQSMKSLGSKRV